MTISASYLPFARKYRPRSFIELLGQEVLVKTINYAILNKRLAQAYLLTGIRGVGKTTSARIIAKTINCTQVEAKEQQVYSCNKCQNCISFNDHNHPDIIEVDAASKTSVEDIRDIIESSEYKPLLGEYKVFIIDEVHMLSKNAFNALLKLLEEPPPHVVFIFATTEVQKLPVTVVSRCQRYDLRRLTFEEIFTLLEKIAKKEKLLFEPEALRIIATKSEGSARDAVALLDQAVSLSAHENAEVTAEITQKMLGIVDKQVIIKFIGYIIKADAREALSLLLEIYNSAADMLFFIDTVSDFLAYLSKAKLIPGYSSVHWSSLGNEVTDIIINASLGQLSILWQIFSKGSEEVKNSHNQLCAAEMLVIKAIYSIGLPTPEELINKELVNTEERCKAGENNPPASSPAVAPALQIIDFLKYLYAEKIMDLYYLLLNQVEITQFSDNNIEISGENINQHYKEQLNSQLSCWTGKKWNVIITKKSEILTLKDQLLNKTKEGKDWKIIEENFPKATLGDILLKT